MQANDWIVSHDQCRITACKHHTYSWVTNVAYFALNFTCDRPWFIQRMHDTEYCGNIPDVNNCSYIQALVIVISIPLIKLGSPIFLAGSTQWHIAPMTVLPPIRDKPPHWQLSPLLYSTLYEQHVGSVTSRGVYYNWVWVVRWGVEYIIHVLIWEDKV